MLNDLGQMVLAAAHTAAAWGGGEASLHAAPNLAWSAIATLSALTALGLVAAFALDAARADARELDRRVAERTAELEATAARLRAEVARHEGIESELRDREARLSRALETIRRNDARLASLAEIAGCAAERVKDLLDFALARAVAITESEHGFVGTYDEDRRRLHLLAWSPGAEPPGGAVEVDVDVDATADGGSVWSEVVRQRRAVFVNGLDPPGASRCGLPGCCAAVRSHLAVPVQRGGRIVALVAVTNKAADYDADDARQLTLLVTSAWRIVERRRAEEALHETEERFRSLVEHAPDAIFVQVGARFAYLNPAAQRLFGASSPAALVGAPIEERVHADSLDAVRERVRVLEIERRPSPRGEHQIVRLDGKSVPVEVSAVPIVWEGGAGALVFARDISERRRLETQVAETQKMESVGRLAGGVAHEFNNKLAVIRGYADIAAEQVEPGSELRHHLDEIRTAAERSAELTQQLLEFSRRQTVEPRDLRLDARVRGHENLLRKLVGHDVALRITCAPDCGWVRIDPVQADHVLVNLVENARDAIAGHGRIEISVRNETRTALDGVAAPGAPAAAGSPRPGEYLLLSVRDTGRGMDEETLSHAFEPFFTTKPFGEGTGLGLAIVWGIVTRAGGFVDVRSAPGQGSTFCVHLPRVPAAELAAPAPAGAPAVRGRGTILVVDDEEAVLRLAATALQAAGYRVLAAASPLDAIAEFERHVGEIDLLLTDVVMPQMDGRQLQERLRELRPDLPTLFMSAYGAERISQHGVLAPGVSLVQKPFSVAALTAKVGELLDGRGETAAAGT